MLAWVPITLAAAGFQVARNASQRGLLPAAGPWAATLVRFLFGLPFALLFALAARLIDPGARLSPGAPWLIACALGGASQILATAALLVAMRRGGFAVGAALQQSAVPLTALMGLVLGERLSWITWTGILLVAGGLAVLAWPGRGAGRAILPGTAAGAGFALASNAFRQAALALVHGHPATAALVTVAAVQAMQAAALGLLLLFLDRRALASVMAAWRTSLAAGFFGAAASGLWFTAFAMAPAGPVRAVGAVETPLSALAGRRMFAERLTRVRLAGLAAAAVGVALAALAS